MRQSETVREITIRVHHHRDGGQACVEAFTDFPLKKMAEALWFADLLRADPNHYCQNHVSVGVLFREEIHEETYVPLR